jgi:esterase/lipase superfamily enzyme
MIFLRGAFARYGSLGVRIFAVVSLLLLIQGAVYAGTTVLLVDLSASMGEACPGSGETSLQVVRKSITNYLRQRKTAAHGDQIGLVVFGQENSVISEPVSDPLRILALAQELKLQGGKSSLANGLRLARSLLPPEGGNVIVYTRSPAELDLLKMLVHTPEGEVRTEINLVSGTSAGGVSTGSVSLRQLACEERLPANVVGTQVLKIVANALGVPAAVLTTDTDLVADLGADRSLVFEALAVVCEQFGAPLPPGGDLTRVGDIVSYVEQSRAQSAARAEGVLRSGPAMDVSEQAVAVQSLFYATDRQPTGDKDPYRFFGSGRMKGGELHYGRCEVTIPVRVHRKGQVESPLLGFEFLRNPKKHIVLKSVQPLEYEAFLEAVSEDLRQAEFEAEWGDDMLIFVHGYNVRFDQAARRTAQIAYDIGFDGVPMMFSWPSTGSLMGYLADRENIEWSVSHIEQFLDELISRLPVGRVHLIAHSMGNEGVLRALRRLARRHAADGKPLFENVILAAPDFDAQIFVEQYASHIKHLARRWTLYASNKDQALNLSTTLRKARRLGIPVAVADGVDTIDATGVEVTPWSVPEFHSYYATKQRVMSDLRGVLLGTEPKRRGNLQQEVKNGGTYWRLELSEAQ